MLATLGVITILCLLAAVMSKRLSPLVALIALPIIAALIGGFGLQTSGFIITGIKNVAPVVGMFVFAILFFGVMTDAGMLDPIIDRILRTVGTRPTRIVVGTALLALLVHLDGSGAVTFLVTIPAMLPLYTRLGIDRRILACVAAMAAGVNFLPWTGPVLRSSAALHVPVSELFQPLIPVQIVGLAFVFFCAWMLGRREEKRLGLGRFQSTAEHIDVVPQRVLTEQEAVLRRPRLFWLNLLLTIAVMGIMISGWVDPVVMFMVGTVLALCINYPNVDAQRARRRPRQDRPDHGQHSSGGRGVHRHHAGHRHAQGHGRSGRVADSGRPRQADPDGGGFSVHAAEPVVRSRFLLFRRDAGNR